MVHSLSDRAAPINYLNLIHTRPYTTIYIQKRTLTPLPASRNPCQQTWRPQDVNS